MGKNSRPLTDPFVKNAKPEARPRKHYDGGGLHLLIKTDGRKYWHLDYRHHGKPKMLALGVYPDTTLAEARKAREAAKALLSDGKDPMVERRAERLAAPGSRSKTALRPSPRSGLKIKIGWSATG